MSVIIPLKRAEGAGLAGTVLPVLLAAAAVWCLAAAPAGGPTPDGLAKAPVWQPPSTQGVQNEVFAWLDQWQVDQTTRAKVAQLWSNIAKESAEPELLAGVAGSLALVDQQSRQLVELCCKPYDRAALSRQAWLTDRQTPPLVANNLRLLYGCWLARESLFDEALEQLADLRPADVVDPAALLFYQAVVYHRLLDRQRGLEAIEQLLAGAQQCPRRYVAVARLMQQDLQDLKDDTLDHIARRMDDIRRRLDLGRAGPKVRQIEDGVIRSLDKLIKTIEEQQQQLSVMGLGSNQSSNPAPDSRILVGKGRGEVTQRNVGAGSGWGNLPPKQREEAMQQIGRDFPSHYRDVIEQYFRKLANEGSK